LTSLPKNLFGASNGSKGAILMFAARVRIANLLMRLSLWALPDCRYKRELVLALADLKADVLFAVSATR
jgi:hypothetical protein